jgi:hypothetical protein
VLLIIDSMRDLANSATSSQMCRQDILHPMATNTDAQPCLLISKTNAKWDLRKLWDCVTFGGQL